MGATDEVTFVEGCGDLNADTSQLSRIEFFLADLHWALIGSIRQGIFDEVTSHSCFESSSAVADLSTTPEKQFMRSVSKAKLRRQRAAKIREQMWKRLQTECKSDIEVIRGDMMDASHLAKTPINDVTSSPPTKKDAAEASTSGFANSHDRASAIGPNERSNDYTNYVDPSAQLKIYIGDGSIRAVEFYPRDMVMVGFFDGVSREPLVISVSKEVVNELMVAIQEHGAGFKSHLSKTYDGGLTSQFPEHVALETKQIPEESLEAHRGPSLEVLEGLVEDCLSAHFGNMNENMQMGCRDMAVAALTEGHSAETIAGQFAELLTSSIDQVVATLEDKIETKWPGCSSIVDIEAAARRHLKETIKVWVSDATAIAHHNVLMRDTSE